MKTHLHVHANATTSKAANDPSTQLPHMRACSHFTPRTLPVAVRCLVAHRLGDVGPAEGGCMRSKASRMEEAGLGADPDTDTKEDICPHSKQQTTRGVL